MWQVQLFSVFELLSGLLRGREGVTAVRVVAPLPRTRLDIAARVRALFLWIKNRVAKVGVDESIFFGCQNR